MIRFAQLFFLVCVVVFVGSLIITIYIPSMYPRKKEVKE